MVEYLCCPAPTTRPDIELNENTKRYRQVLKSIVYGEIGVVIGLTYLFGLFVGLCHLTHMWMDYLAYATMNQCSFMLLGFAACMELLLLFMNANDGGLL